MPKQKWEIGSVFIINLTNGKYVICQVVGIEPKTLNSFTCAIFDIVIDNPNEFKRFVELPSDKIFSIQFVTKDLLNKGIWQVITKLNVLIDDLLMPFNHLKSSGYVGAKVIGSGIITNFVNAYYGLHPWDDWYKPDYLDSFLLSPTKKPDNLIYKN